MSIQLLLTFIILNVINVVLQTVRSLATVKCGKGVAALVNAVCYGVYTIVIVFTMCELPLLLKAVIVGLCNLVGVFFVKLSEEKLRKDKLWKVEATVTKISDSTVINHVAKCEGLSFNCIRYPEFDVFNFYCSTQEESLKVKQILIENNVKKYFVSESEVL